MDNFFAALNKYDIPNWLVILSNIFWILLIWIKSKFRYSQIEGLAVHLKTSFITIKTAKGPLRLSAVGIEFKNNTDSKLIIFNATLGKCQNKFDVDPTAFKNTLTNEYELKFENSFGNLEDTIKILDTNKSTFTALAVQAQVQYAGRFADIKKSRLKWIFGPEYFCLNYTVNKGNKFYRVRTYY